MTRLLTRKDLAERWQVTERTIDEYRATGVIVPIKGIPSIRYNPQYIETIEGHIPERVTTETRLLRAKVIKLELEKEEMRIALKAVNLRIEELIKWCMEGANG